MAQKKNMMDAGEQNANRRAPRSSGRGRALAAGAFVVALGVGFGGGFAAGDSSGSTTQSVSSAPAAVTIEQVEGPVIDGPETPAGYAYSMKGNQIDGPEMGNVPEAAEMHSTTVATTDQEVGPYGVSFGPGFTPGESPDSI